MTGRVFWITGLSGVGKTTFARHLKQRMEALRLTSVLLDGDVIREVFADKPGYTREARLENAYRYSRLAAFLAEQNVHVVVSTISLFHEVQEFNREHIPDYYEILIRRDFDQLVQEDNKNIYQQAISGKISDVVGVDIEAEYPESPALLIEDASPDELDAYVEKCLASLKAA